MRAILCAVLILAPISAAEAIQRCDAEGNCYTYNGRLYSGYNKSNGPDMRLFGQNNSGLKAIDPQGAIWTYEKSDGSFVNDQTSAKITVRPGGGANEGDTRSGDSIK